MSNNSDVKINIKADTNEALRNLRQVEKQVDKVGNLADQGERQQKGFLSKAQVNFYKRLLKEMEQAHSQHTIRLENAEKNLESLRNHRDKARAKQLEEEIRKRTELLRNAEGGNRWGEQAHSMVQEYHRQKLDSSKEELESLTSSTEYKTLVSSTNSLESQIEKLREVMENMQNERERAQPHIERAGELRVRDQYTDQAQGLVGMAGALMPIGPLALAHYAGRGVGMLRDQEESAWQVSQKMGSFEGMGQHDEYLRTSIKDPGVENGYSTKESAITMGNLIRGGTNGDLEARTQDMDSVQRLSRGNAMEVNEIAIASADLQKIGAVSEGNLQRFAELISGSIEKSGMQGREEELLRSVSGLASSVSSGLSGLSEARLGELMGIQSQFAEAIPTISGDKGTEILTGMDSAIKGGSNAFDLIMGKGVLPEFSGIKGSYNLSMMKEQGLTSSTLQYMFKGLDRMYGQGNHELKALSAQEQFGLSIETYNKMVDSGLDNQFKTGNAVGEDEIRALGDASLTKDYESYKDSSTSEVHSMNSWSDNRQADLAQPIDEAHKGIMGTFNELPRWAQNTALVGAGMMGMPLAYRGAQYLARKVSPKVNGTGGMANGAKSLGSSIASKTGGIWDNIKGAGGSLIDKAKDVGGNLTDKVKGVKDVGVMDDVAKTSLKVGAKIPVAGALIGTVGDQIINEENSWGRSISKGVGGAIGGTLGLLAGGALGLGTGGLGFAATGATTVGGAVAGEKLGDSLYSLFTGDKKASASEAIPKHVSQGLDRMYGDNEEMKSLALKEQFGVPFESQASVNIGKGIASAGTEHTIKITVDGNIEGMTKNNQDEVSIGVRKYFEKLVKNNNTGINLSFDQTRG